MFRAVLLRLRTSGMFTRGCMHDMHGCERVPESLLSFQLAHVVNGFQAHSERICKMATLYS